LVSRKEIQKSPNIFPCNLTLKINSIASPNPTNHSKKLNNNKPGRPLWFAFFIAVVPNALKIGKIITQQSTVKYNS
jgi:hypothetical protein